MEPIELETKRLILRDHVIEDLETHHELFSDTQTMYYLQDLMTHSMEESHKNLMLAMNEVYNSERTMYFLRMEEKETKEHIGEVGYTVKSFTPVGKIVHLGYFIRKKYWNQGYTTEAVKEMLRYAFVENEVVVVQTGCISDNVSSWYVMEKCGMVREAEHKCNEWHENLLKDRFEYRMLKEEWLHKMNVRT